MTVRVIAAVSLNGVLVCTEESPMRLKGHLELLEQCTIGRTVLMDESTYRNTARELISGRNVIVLSKTMHRSPYVHVIRNLNDIRNVTMGEIDVIGGADLIDLLIRLGLVDKFLLTHVYSSVGRITGTKEQRFNNINLYSFVPVKKVKNQHSNKDNEYSFETILYIK